ncbi:hypothetical protein BC828DRAFT_382492 [Blastocladiella britannica]|nr:hypothetical protein BC828DRAFT_382492 [Blastocladiella britannica]
MNFLKRTAATSATPTSDPPFVPTTNLDPSSPSVDAPAHHVDNEEWFASAHAHIATSLSQSLQTLQLWEQLRLKHAQLAADARDLAASRDHLAAYATYLDGERARLDAWAHALESHDRRASRARGAFDTARRRWCDAAGLDPETTFAIVEVEYDSDGETKGATGGDTDAAPVAVPTPVSKRERAAGMVGSALKTAINLTGATGTLSRIDKTYNVRDRVTGVPLLASFVQSALVPGAAANGAALESPTLSSSSGCSCSCSGSECSCCSSDGDASDSDENLDGTATDDDALSEDDDDIPVVEQHPPPLPSPQQQQGYVAAAAGAVLRRAVSVANMSGLGSTTPTPAPVTQSPVAAAREPRTLRTVQSQPVLRRSKPVAAATAAAAAAAATGSSSSSSSSTTSRTRPVSMLASSSPRHHNRDGDSGSATPPPAPRPKSYLSPLPASALPIPPRTTSSSLSPPIGRQTRAVPPPPPSASAPYYHHPQPASLPPQQQSSMARSPQLMPSLSSYGPGISAATLPTIGVDELGTLFNTVSTVASVAQSVGGSTAADAVKSVGGWALGKVLSGER